MKYNLSEFIMTFYYMCWVIINLDFKKNDWNELCYYECPDQIKISLKIIDYENIIVRLDYDNNKLLKVSFNNLYSLIDSLFDPYKNATLINKARTNQRRLNNINEDFEE